MLTNISSATDDQLAEELMTWFRIYRNEGTLPKEERTYFKNIVAEVDKRDILPRQRKTLKEMSENL